MNEQELATLVNLVMESILGGGATLESLHDTQIIIRPIFTWPDGQPAIWVMVNFPN
jgi:hypothetical protein